MRRNSDSPENWIDWLDRGAPELLASLEWFRMVLLNEFPFPYLEVHRWIWFLLCQEIVTTDDIFTDCAAALRTSGELHAISQRDRRLGLCQWREMIITRIRTPFAGRSYDCERVFRNSEGRIAQTPGILIMGHAGPNSTWEVTTTGVESARSDDPDNLNWDGVILVPGTQRK